MTKDDKILYAIDLFSEYNSTKAQCDLMGALRDLLKKNPGISGEELYAMVPKAEPAVGPDYTQILDEIFKPLDRTKDFSVIVSNVSRRVEELVYKFLFRKAVWDGCSLIEADRFAARPSYRYSESLYHVCTGFYLRFARDIIDIVGLEVPNSDEEVEKILNENSKLKELAFRCAEVEYDFPYNHVSQVADAVGFTLPDKYKNQQ